MKRDFYEFYAPAPVGRRRYFARQAAPASTHVAMPFAAQQHARTAVTNTHSNISATDMAPDSRAAALAQAKAQTGHALLYYHVFHAPALMPC